METNFPHIKRYLLTSDNTTRLVSARVYWTWMTFHILFGLFGSIRTIRDYVLFDFSRHLFRPSRHSTQERGLLRSFLVREACTRHQIEAVW